ncbi:hypothetical protein, partial [Neisseria sp. HMSC070F02]|uniref:hypothetical protein n=1 Tax=Neisseria sp. HMSC070F02 TaxID=1739463 RepID=UPI000AF953D2
FLLRWGLDSRFRGNDDPRSRVIPAQAGILSVWFLFFRWIPVIFRLLDSRFCGNDGFGVSVFSDGFLLRWGLDSRF